VRRGWQGARSLVILKSGEELNRLIGLPLAIGDVLVIDPDPFVAPLERVLVTHPKMLVAEIGKETARFWTSHLGLRRDFDDLEDFVPSDTVDRSRPREGAAAPADHLDWHLRRAARLADHLFADEGWDELVLCGDERICAMLEEVLPRPLADRLTLVLPPAEHGEIEREIERHLAREQARREEEAVGQLEEARGEGAGRGGAPGGARRRQPVPRAPAAARRSRGAARLRLPAPSPPRARGRHLPLLRPGAGAGGARDRRAPGGGPPSRPRSALVTERPELLKPYGGAAILRTCTEALEAQQAEPAAAAGSARG
jgi:release factor family 10